MTIRPAIRERIIQAAETLLAEGVASPTNTQVREFLGGGSLAHISPVMREWRAARQAEITAVPVIPPELAQGMATLLKQLWSKASRLAGAEMEQVRREAGTVLDIVTRERDEALSDIVRLEDVVSELQAQLVGAEKSRQDHEALSQRLTTENATLTVRVSDKDIQLAALKEELDTYRADTRQLQEQLLDIARQATRG